jgi:hypothetical protein
MTTSSLPTTPEEQRLLERFYFHEARLLDNRQYRQWLGLLSEDVRYVIPSRVNVQVNNRDRGQEDMLSVERELEGEDSMGCPLREEGYLLLMLRAERAYKINSWSESPPARTRRIIGNIELLARDGAYAVGGQQLPSLLRELPTGSAVVDAGHMVYSGQRRDTLVSVADGFRIRSARGGVGLRDYRVADAGPVFLAAVVAGARGAAYPCSGQMKGTARMVTSAISRFIGTPMRRKSEKW